MERYGKREFPAPQMHAATRRISSAVMRDPLAPNDLTQHRAFIGLKSIRDVRYSRESCYQLCQVRDDLNNLEFQGPPSSN